MRVIPITIGPASTHIRIDHQSLFPIVASLTQSGESDVIKVQIIREDVGRLLIQARVKAAGVLKTPVIHQLVGWMTPHEPRAIEFEGTNGPVSLLQLRLTMTEEGGCTNLEYRGAIGRGYWLLGWAMTYLFAKPIVNKALQCLLTEIKDHAERDGAQVSVLTKKCQHSNS